MTPATQTPGYGPILRVLVLATFVVILNETIMVNAIPRLMREFAVPATDAQWLSTAFMLTMAVVIPVTGWFLQRVTTRAAFATAMAVFCAGTLLAALAWVFPVLLVARVVQATGTAVMMPLLMTTLMTLVPAQERGSVMGRVTLVISVAPALGPAVSGLVLDFASWRWIFGVVLPIAALITVWGLRGLVNVAEPRPGSVDWPSVALAALGFGGLVYGLSQFGEAARTAAVPPAVAVAVGAAGIAAFVWRQLRLQRSGAPLLDLRTLGHSTFTVSLAVMAVSFMAMLGVMILLPLYLQEVHEYSTLTTGLLLMPGAAAMGLLGPTVGRLFDRFGARALVVPGAAAMVVGLVLLSRVTATTPGWWLLAMHMVLMVSLAFVFTPVFTVGLGALPPNLYPHGSSLLGTLQQVAAAAGTAMVVTLMANRAATLTASGSDPLTALGGGVRWGIGAAALMGVVVLALAFCLPRHEPQAAHGDVGDGGGPALEEVAEPSTI